MTTPRRPGPRPAPLPVPWRRRSPRPPPPVVSCCQAHLFIAVPPSRLPTQFKQILLFNQGPDRKRYNPSATYGTRATVGVVANEGVEVSRQRDIRSGCPARTRCSSANGGTPSWTWSATTRRWQGPCLTAMGGRPVLLQRFPHGAGGSSFFQKRVPAAQRPAWLTSRPPCPPPTAPPPRRWWPSRPSPRGLGGQPWLSGLPCLAQPGGRPRPRR